MSTTTIPDLWPSDLSGPPTLTPVAILRRQGEALGARTRNFVYGEVETRPIKNGTSFEHQFMVAAPFLRFRYPLFRVTHGITPFPAVFAESDLAKSQGPAGVEWVAEVNNEEEFQSKLQEFLNRERVKAAIRSLIAQSGDIETEDTDV